MCSESMIKNESTSAKGKPFDKRALVRTSSNTADEQEILLPIDRQHSTQNMTSYSFPSPNSATRYAADTNTGENLDKNGGNNEVEVGGGDLFGDEAHQEQDTADGESYTSDSDEEVECSSCHEYIQNCHCRRCDTCNKLEHQCGCEICVRCQRRDSFCTCPSCNQCARQIPECECDGCTICSKIPYDCKCVDHKDFKVMVEGRLIENVDTAQLVTRRVRHTEPLEGGPTEGETLVLRGDLKSCRVLVIRKPSVILSTVYRAARGSVISRYENAWQKLMATTMYQRSKPWYDAMLCYLEPEVEATHVNVTTVRGVRKMVTELAKIAHDPRKPTIGFDCEGDNLGRYGTTCYIQIRDYTKQQTYLVDLLFLGQAAWETVGCDETTTLRTIFENQNIVKIIFDVRGDSNALYKDYKIRLAGVLDMQYLALLGMAYPRRCRVGFVTTIRSAHFMSNEEKDHWLTLKNHKFKDNDYSVFKKRPLPKALKLYAVNDVIGVDKLAAGLTRKLTERGVDLAFAWTQKDIEWTWEDEYENREEKTPRGFDACWNEDINQYTHRAITGRDWGSQSSVESSGW